jgi:hypothetical protein
MCLTGAMQAWLYNGECCVQLPIACKDVIKAVRHSTLLLLLLLRAR